jgi:hypothetical protein
MAYTSYTPYEWKNAPDHKTTPLSADNLNHMEGGIADSYKFDNTGTDLSSTNKEDAIKEVNAKTMHGIYELWVNPSASSNFAGQSIQISVDKIIDTLFIEAGQQSNALYPHGLSVCEVGNSAYIEIIGVSSGGKIQRYTREMSASQSNGTLTVSIGDCTKAEMSAFNVAPTTSTTNNMLIPVRIFGVVHNS